MDEETGQEVAYRKLAEPLQPSTEDQTRRFRSRWTEASTPLETASVRLLPRTHGEIIFESLTDFERAPCGVDSVKSSVQAWRKLIGSTDHRQLGTQPEENPLDDKWSLRALHGTDGHAMHVMEVTRGYRLPEKFGSSPEKSTRPNFSFAAISCLQLPEKRRRSLKLEDFGLPSLVAKQQLSVEEVAECFPQSREDA